MTDPVFTVVTISWEDEPGLARTLRSVVPLLERHPEVEHVVVDGGSGYDVRGLVGRLSPRSRVVSERDKGIYDAMNKGIDLARGRFLNFINSGDEFLWEGLFEAVDFAACEFDFIYGDSLERVDGRDEAKPAGHHAGVEMGMFTHHQAMIFRRGFVIDHGIRHDDSLRIAGDWDFVIQVLRRAPRVLHVPRPLCRFEAGGVSQRQIALSRKEVFALRRKYFGVASAVGRQSLQDAAKVLRRGSPRAYWLARNLYSRATHWRAKP